MAFPFSFEGKIGRFQYLLWSAAAFLSQHLAVLIACRLLRIEPNMDVLFWVGPLRTLATQIVVSDALLIASFAFFLLIAWVLAVLAFRRAADANENEAIAVLAMAPIVQIPIILYLAALPTRQSEPASAPRVGASLRSSPAS